MYNNRKAYVPHKVVIPGLTRNPEYREISWIPDEDLGNDGKVRCSVNQAIVKSIPIPLPPLATQQAIVAAIETEQALVAGNRELIARFEKKIQVALARVWGEDEPAPTEA